MMATITIDSFPGHYLLQALTLEKIVFGRDGWNETKLLSAYGERCTHPLLMIDDAQECLLGFCLHRGRRETLEIVRLTVPPGRLYVSTVREIVDRLSDKAVNTRRDRIAIRLPISLAQPIVDLAETLQDCGFTMRCSGDDEVALVREINRGNA